MLLKFFLRRALKAPKKVIRRSLGNRNFDIYFAFLLSVGFKKERVVVFDLDDTLCNNPIHQLQGDAIVSKNAYESAVFDFRLFNHLIARYPRSDIIILTARDTRFRRETARWLDRNGVNAAGIFFSGSAQRKIKFLKYFLRRYEKVVYVDDLSYFCSGARCFYERVISWCRDQINIEYIGWDFLRNYRTYSS